MKNLPCSRIYLFALQTSKAALLLGVAAACLLSAAEQTVLAEDAVTNGVYEARVARASDLDTSPGSWMAFTGALHPTGAGNDILFDEGGGFSTESSNFSTLRVYNSVLGGVQDYVPDSRDNGASDIGRDSSIIFEGPTPAGAFGAGTYSGQRTTWGLTAEGLSFTQDVLVAGTVFANSAVYHTVVVSNTGGVARNIGWRNLYDWQVDEAVTDDGPNNQVETAAGATVVAATTTEFTHTPGANQIVRVSVDPGVPTYQPLLGLTFDPGFIPGLSPTAPEAYAYARWPTAVGTDFDYTTVAVSATGDSAGLSWWGRTAGTAISLEPGESARFTQVLFGVIPEAPPPGEAVPEPSGVALLALGLLPLGYFAWRKRRRG